MVAEATRLDAMTVYRTLSYARGLQFQTIWLKQQGIELQRMGKQAKLRMVL